MIFKMKNSQKGDLMNNLIKFKLIFQLLNIFNIFFINFYIKLNCNIEKFGLKTIQVNSILKTAKDLHQQEKLETRDWLILVYIAADNDLHYFAWNNIKQLAKGANKNVYIIVQLNEPGKSKKTQLYLIEKNKAILLNKENQKKLDSGDPQTLIDFCVWSIKKFPATNHMLVLSDHGSGIIDRSASRLINPAEFFVLNPTNLMLELDRSMEFLSFLEKSKNDSIENNDPKGVCFDETHQSYFTNQKLEFALQKICIEASNILNVKNFKFQILGMDACLMQMIEIADIVKKYAKTLVASVEVELGPGWRYDKILDILQNKKIDYLTLAKHIVNAYQETYVGITNDFTLSAIDLELVDNLSNNINSISEILIILLQNQKNDTVRNVLKKCKSNVAFEEPSYIDIASFYQNVLKNINQLEINENFENLKATLQQNINWGLDIIKKMVIQNVSGKNIQYAQGVSIYFPEKRIHNSYRKTNFAQNNQWLNLLSHYVN